MSKIVKDFEVAKKRGLTFYYPDKLCSKGHKSKRYTNDKKCVECVHQRSKIYGKIYFQKNKVRLKEIRKNTLRITGKSMQNIKDNIEKTILKRTKKRLLKGKKKENYLQQNGIRKIKKKD